MKEEDNFCSWCNNLWGIECTVKKIVFNDLIHATRQRRQDKSHHLRYTSIAHARSHQPPSNYQGFWIWNVSVDRIICCVMFSNPSLRGS